MSAMKDAVATMGNVLPDDAGGRDAVHVAVFSATSVERLFPGQDIAIAQRGELDAVVTSQGEHVAIVDPFLRGSVEPGNRFWAYLYPRTITALSHRWGHPAFEKTDSVYAPPAGKLTSEQWLRDFINRSDCPGYEDVIAAAAKVADDRNNAFDPDYLHFNDRDAHGEIPAEFWDHVAVVLGRPIKGQRPTYFSCSC